MKSILSLFCLLAFATGITAQSLTLSNANGAVPHNSYVTIAGAPTTEMLTSAAAVTNNSNSAIEVKVKKIENYLVDNSMNTFCWGLCFPPFVYESPDPLTIGPGETNDEDFWGEYFPTQTTGTSSITYVFFDSNNPVDSVAFITLYKTDGIPDIASVTPGTAVAGEQATFQITGVNTHFGVYGVNDVILKRGTDILHASAITVSSTTLMTAEFSIPSNAAAGAWDIEVETGLDGILKKENAITITGISGIGDAEAAGIMQIFPNPATELAFIRLPDYEKGTGHLTVRNTMGALVYSATVKPQDGLYLLSAEPFEKGIYFVRLNVSGNVFSGKLIVQ